MSNEINYHFFPATLNNYTTKSFKDLQDEMDEFGYIYWKISNAQGKYAHKVKKNDICYFYYSGLPDQSSRILFRGIVEESDYENKTNAKNKKLYIKIKLYCISLENKETFSLKNLREKYGIVAKKGQIGYRTLDANTKLVKDLENNKSRKPIKSAVDYFNDYCFCEFKGHDQVRKNHNTFIEMNGCYYIERHHLVERNLIKKYSNRYKDIDKLIENEQNIFSLCPNCHMEIHHGTKERRQEKIKYLYKKHQRFFDENFKQLKGNQKTIDWLYEIYKCQ